MKNQFYFYLMVILFSFQITAKEKTIIYDKNTAAQLKANHVREIKVFQGKETEFLTHRYQVDKEGIVVGHIHFDTYSGITGPVVEEYSYDGLSKKYSKGRRNKDGKTVLSERVITTLTESGKTVKIEKEEHVDFFIHTIELFDTAYDAGIDLVKYVIHENSGDTLRLITHKKVRQEENYVVSVKDSGRWKEEERSVTTFDKDGRYIRYTLYRNGKEYTSYTREEREIKMDSSVFYGDENRNPLPAADPRVDTLYSQTADITFPFQGVKRGKYMVIQAYNCNNVKPEQLSVYDSNGLILKYFFIPNDVANERYEYEFRK